MFREVPFNVRGNVEKGREMGEKLLELLADQRFNPLGRVGGALASFRVDVLDTGIGYEVFAELPGYRKEEITVSYDEDGYLKIKAEREYAGYDEARFICHERRDGEVERLFKVDGIDKAGVSVAFENGLLHIVLPKAVEETKSTVFDIG